MWPERERERFKFTFLKMSVNLSEVWPLARILHPAILHNVVDLIRAAVWTVHTITSIKVVNNILDTLE